MAVMDHGNLYPVKWSYTDKKLKNESVKTALEAVESARKRLESAIYDYIYNDDTYNQLSLGQKVKYFFKSTFQCPVNIEVYNAQTDELLGSVIDGAVSYKDGIMIELKGDVKIIYIPQDKKVRYKLTGTDEGTMDYVLEEYQDGIAVSRLNYYEIPLTKGNSYSQVIEVEELPEDLNSLPLIKENGESILADEYISAADSEALVNIIGTPEGNGTILGAGDYAKGDPVELTAIADDGYRFIGWYEDDVLVDYDSNYYFPALSDTTITAKFSKIPVILSQYLIKMSEAYKDNAAVTLYGNEGDSAEIVISMYNTDTTPDMDITVVQYDENGKEISKQNKKALCDGEFGFRYTISDFPLSGWNSLGLLDSTGNLIASINGSVQKSEQTFTGPTTYEKTYGDETFKLEVKLSEGDGKLFYHSSNPSVATVSNLGDVTILGIGSATITMTAAETEKYAETSMDITVTVAKAEQHLQGTASYTKKVGDAAFPLGITLTQGNGRLSYISSDEKIVSVDNEGNVTIVGSGTAEITVTSPETNEYKEAKTVVAITVTASGSTIAPTPSGNETPTVTSTPSVPTTTPGATGTPGVPTTTPGATGTPGVTGTPTPAPDTPNKPSKPENPVTTVTENPDGSKTETTVSTEKTEDGSTIHKTEVVQKDPNGKITGSTITTILSANPQRSGVSVTIKVTKDAKGKVTAATADISGGIYRGGNDALIQGRIVKWIVKIAGTTNVTIRAKKQNRSFTVTANASDLTAGKKLFIVQKKANGTRVLVNAKTYTVTKDGDVYASITGNKNYGFINRSAMNRLSKSILKTIKVKKTSRTVKKSKTVKMALKKTLKMANVKSIKYTVSKKAIANVNNKGIVTGKKSGTSTVKAKVTLKNGRTKTVRMKVKVKK